MVFCVQDSSVQKNPHDSSYRILRLNKAKGLAKTINHIRGKVRLNKTCVTIDPYTYPLSHVLKYLGGTYFVNGLGTHITIEELG